MSRVSDGPGLPVIMQGHLEPGASPEEHQPDGTSPRGLLLFTIVLFTFIALSLVAVGILFALLRATPNSAVRYEEPLPPSAGGAAAWVNEPYLYQRWLEGELDQLDHYHWIDRRRGVVQLRIERAMDLLVAQRSGASSQPASSRPAAGGAP